MSEFLKFAYELISQVIYNIVVWLAAFLKLLITGWADYFLIFTTYFPTLNIDRDPGSFDRSDHQADDPASSVKGG